MKSLTNLTWYDANGNLTTSYDAPNGINQCLTSDSNLQPVWISIDNLQVGNALNAEKLDNHYSNYFAIASDLSNEVTRATGVENTLAINIESNQQAIANEVNRATAADIQINANIQNINSKFDNQGHAYDALQLVENGIAHNGEYYLDVNNLEINGTPDINKVVGYNTIDGISWVNAPTLSVNSAEFSMYSRYLKDGDTYHDSGFYTNASNINTGILSTDRLPVIPLSKGGTGTVLGNTSSANMFISSNGNGGVEWKSFAYDINATPLTLVQRNASGDIIANNIMANYVYGNAAFASYAKDGVGVGSNIITTEQIINAASSIIANDVAIGNNSSAINSIAIGFNAHSIDNGVSLGYNTMANRGSIAIGYNAHGLGGDASTNANSIAIGANSSATENNAIAFGSNAHSYSDNCIAIGADAFIANNYANSTAIGYKAEVRANNAVQLGQGINTNDNSIQIGDKILMYSNEQVIVDQSNSIKVQIRNGSLLYNAYYNLYIQDYEPTSIDGIYFII